MLVTDPPHAFRGGGGEWTEQRLDRTGPCRRRLGRRRRSRRERFEEGDESGGRGLVVRAGADERANERRAVGGVRACVCEGRRELVGMFLERARRHQQSIRSTEQV